MVISEDQEALYGDEAGGRTYYTLLLRLICFLLPYFYRITYANQCIIYSEARDKVKLSPLT